MGVPDAGIKNTGRAADAFAAGLPENENAKKNGNGRGDGNTAGDPAPFSDNERLLREYRDGTPEEKERIMAVLLENNMRLVRRAVRLIGLRQNGAIDEEDLFQEGCMGIMRAIECFDPDKGTKFSTYATYWIQQHVIRYIHNNQASVRVPVHIATKVALYRRLSGEYEKNPSADEDLDGYVLRNTGWSEEEYAIVKNADFSVVSLDKEFGQDGEDSDGESFYNTIDDSSTVRTGTAWKGPEDIAAENDVREAIGKALDRLTEREKDIIIRRYGLFDREPETLREIGESYGLSRERVRQLESKALRKLRAPSRAKYLRDYG